jgi:hypothetical protein
LAQVVVGARLGEGARAIAGTVIGHDALRIDAELCIEGQGGGEEGDRSLLFIVGQERGEGDAGVVVDEAVDELPPSASQVVAAIPRDSMADTFDASHA